MVARSRHKNLRRFLAKFPIFEFICVYLCIVQVFSGQLKNWRAMRILAVMIIMSSLVVANPFVIDVKEPDYKKMERCLREIDVEFMTRWYYLENHGYVGFDEFCGRIGTSKRFKLVEEGKDPIAQLEKIGEGGENCIVTYSSINANYPIFVRSLIKGLKACGFNGYIWYRIGGYPHANEKDIQYAGVPYTFKVAMMQEAHQMGFDRILWLDSAMIPLQDLSHYFGRIRNEGAYFWGIPMPQDNWRYIFPIARESIKDLTSVDVMEGTTVMGAIFGLDFKAAQCHRFLEVYYKLVEDGYPFLSCMPEEFVLGAILNMPEFKEWDPKNRWEDILPLRCSHPNLDSVEEIEKSRELQYPFHHRCMRNIMEGWDAS